MPRKPAEQQPSGRPFLPIGNVMPGATAKLRKIKLPAVPCNDPTGSFASGGTASQGNAGPPQGFLTPTGSGLGEARPWGRPLADALPCQRQCAAIAVLACLIAAPATAVGDSESIAQTAARPSYSRGLVELKRQSTARGTPQETTKTNLKFDYFPIDGTVSLLRLELPFPDQKTTFVGSPFNPDFGDAKIRVGFHAFDLSGRPITSFVEMTFPTANPESQGTGKYQLSGGLKSAWQLSPGPDGLGTPRQSCSVQIQQVVSFAGDPARDDINQTKFELEWRNTWGVGHYAKATAKPVIDWVGNGQTGAVLDVEGGWRIGPQWTLAALVGGRLWGEGVPGTYAGRAEIKVVYRY